MMVVQQALAIISFLMNCLLISLILTKSPKTMGSYKYLMIFMSGFEIFYAFIDLLIQPEVVTMDSFWLSMTSAKRSVLPLEVAYPLLLVWGGSFGIALACFGIHFVYRYLIITGNKKWTTGTSSIFLWISVPILSGFVYVFAIHYFWQLSEVMDTFVRAALEKSEEVSKSQLIFFSSYPFKTIPKSEVILLDWLQIYGVIFLCSSVSLSFFTMIYFGLKTYSAMRKFREATSTDSASSKNLQTQLFYSLVIQTIIPVILIHFPTTLIYISTFFDAAYPVYGKIVTVTISLFPAIDPLPSLLIIRPYRRAIRGCFMGNFGLKGGISVEPSNRGTSTMYTRRTAQF
ncbi:hypothetical protein CRE_09028 [Caenorhabditis remanei]|uniref:Seven TM Receptor n=1 Tax=Caenorhabditis remanei TaxID=31234 RepID=E3LIV6_CAERE|nr:hypothetical protein CRE_09028 [Caenorhabditis remanei]